MTQEIEVHKRRGTVILLGILAIWGLGVAIAAETGIYQAMPPLLIAPLITLGMAGIQTLPMALIPLYGVGISGANHIMAFDLLRRHKGIDRQMMPHEFVKT
jgi:hypothetical protein